MYKAIIADPTAKVNTFDHFKARVLSFVEKANKDGARIDLDRARFWIDTETKGNSYKALVCGILFCSNPQTMKILVKFNGHKAII